MTAWYLVIALLLVLANGFFVGAEFAVTAVRRDKLQARAGGDLRARLALKSTRELQFIFAGSQLGITMASLGLGYVAEPAVAHLLEVGLGSFVDLPAALVHPISVVVGFAIVVLLHIVIGEIAPKNVALADPERSALAAAIPLWIFLNAFRPAIRFLSFLADAGIRLIGIERQEESDPSRAVKEIATAIEVSARGGVLDEFEHRLLSGAIGLSGRDAASAMIPRTEIVALPLGVTPAEIERTIMETGHSRLPIYGRDLDHVLGFFHAKDLLGIPGEASDRPIPRRLIRQMLVVPESRKLHPLLLDMRREQKHFALVVDEHGGTAGIVTLEDLLEEIVGEIKDEYDVAELGIEQLNENRYLVPGTLRVDEASDYLGLRLPDGDYETIAGFLMSSLGRVPKKRDRVDHDGWRLRVRDMQRRRVAQVLVERVPEAADLSSTDP